MTLNQEIVPYVKQLMSAFPGIQSIWLIGSRANENYRIDSDWDLLAFSDGRTFSKMKQDRSLRNPDVDLLVVYNGNDFEEPWPVTTEARPNPKGGSLQSWKWHKQSETKATYRATKDLEDGKFDIIENRKAIRIWPIESA